MSDYFPYDVTHYLHVNEYHYGVENQVLIVMVGLTTV